MIACLRHLAARRLMLVALAFAPSCGGTPVRPSEPSPTLTILSSKNELRVGESVDMALQAAFSDGRTTLLAPVRGWGTDRPDIVDVKPLSASRLSLYGEEWLTPEMKLQATDHILIARVTALAPGNAIVTADSEYGVCQRAIRVIAD